MELQKMVTGVVGGAFPPSQTPHKAREDTIRRKRVAMVTTPLDRHRKRKAAPRKEEKRRATHLSFTRIVKEQKKAEDCG
jgi:hypothetical protein